MCHNICILPAYAIKPVEIPVPVGQSFSTLCSMSLRTQETVGRGGGAVNGWKYHHLTLEGGVVYEFRGGVRASRETFFFF